MYLFGWHMSSQALVLLMDTDVYVFTKLDGMIVNGFELVDLSPKKLTDLDCHLF